MAKSIFGAPGGDSYTEAKAVVCLAGGVLEEFSVDCVDITHDLVESSGVGDGREGAPKVGFASDGHKRAGPFVGRSITY